MSFLNPNLHYGICDGKHEIYSPDSCDYCVIHDSIIPILEKEGIFTPSKLTVLYYSEYREWGEHFTNSNTVPLSNTIKILLLYLKYPVLYPYLLHLLEEKSDFIVNEFTILLLLYTGNLSLITKFKDELKHVTWLNNIYYLDIYYMEVLEGSVKYDERIINLLFKEEEQCLEDIPFSIFRCLYEKSYVDSVMIQIIKLYLKYSNIQNLLSYRGGYSHSYPYYSKLKLHLYYCDVLRGDKKYFDWLMNTLYDKDLLKKAIQTCVNDDEDSHYEYGILKKFIKLYKSKRTYPIDDDDKFLDIIMGS